MAESKARSHLRQRRTAAICITFGNRSEGWIAKREREKLRYSREHIVNHRNIPCTKGREQPHTVFIQLEEQKVSTSPRRTSLEGSVYWRTTGHSTGAVSAKVMPGPAKLCRLVTGCEDCEKTLLQWTTGAKIANKLQGNLKKAHSCWA